MARVARPTCGLSITKRSGCSQHPGLAEIELAVGSCPDAFTAYDGRSNDVRPPTDIGLVGKTKGKYTILVGGRLLGNRLNFVYKDLVPEEQIVQSLVPLLANFKLNRLDGETLGDFCDRHGPVQLLAWCDAFAQT
jgi:sulfite reductase (ferredoxin)